MLEKAWPVRLLNQRTIVSNCTYQKNWHIYYEAMAYMHFNLKQKNVLEIKDKYIRRPWKIA